MPTLSFAELLDHVELNHPGELVPHGGLAGHDAIVGAPGHSALRKLIADPFIVIFVIGLTVGRGKETVQGGRVLVDDGRLFFFPEVNDRDLFVLVGEN